MNLDIFNSLFSNLWSIFLVIVFFTGSIFVHELGHFWAAKRRGLKVERFSIGFGPKIFGWTKDGTEYRISLFPLGGYVALPQLADMGAIEGGAGDNKSLPAISYTDKMLVSVMGAVFNLIFAFILALIIWIVGQPSSKEQLTHTVGYVAKTINLDSETEVPGPAYEAGIRAGDKILEVDGIKVNGFDDLQQHLVTGTGRSETGKPMANLTVERDGAIRAVAVYPELVELNSISKERVRYIGISPEQALVVGETVKNSPAYFSKLEKGDILVAANGVNLYSLKTLSDVLEEDPEHKVFLNIKRNNKLIEIPLQAEETPYTKPLGLLSALTEQNETTSLKLLPDYAKGVTEALSDPSTPSRLMVFDRAQDGLFFKEVLEGDVLLSINGEAPKSLEDFSSIVGTILPGQSVTLMMDRGRTPYSIVFTPKNLTSALLPAKTHYLIGIQLNPSPLIIHVNPFVQFSNNINMTFRTLSSLFSSGSDLSVSNLMGPPGIIRVLHTFSVVDLRLLVWFVILLNINLAILNLMPIPVLDGGHMVFATIAKIRGKAIPLKLIAGIQSTFMILLFSLMLYVSFFDVRRWQGDRELEENILRQRALYIPSEFSSKQN